MTTTRRPRGEGSIYPDKDRGGYIGAVRIDGRLRKVRGKTKTEVARKMGELRAQTPTQRQAADLSVVDVLDRYRDGALAEREQDLRPATLQGYEDNLAVLRREFDGVPLSALNVQRVRDGLERIASGRYGRGAPLARSTMKHVRATLAQALDEAVENEWMTRNTATVARLPKSKPVAERESLTVDEALTLWDALGGERLGNLFRLLLTTGLRPGEARGLCWDAVDLERGRLHVWRNAQRQRNGSYRLVDLVKTEGSYRTLLLAPPALDALRAQRKVAAELRLASRSWDRNDPGLVFPTVTGNLWDGPKACHELAAICKRAGLWRVRPYELRHSAASILSAHGVPLESIADYLGHDVNVTATIYRKRIRPEQDAAVQVMGDLFSGRAT